MWKAKSWCKASWPWVRAETLQPGRMLCGWLEFVFLGELNGFFKWEHRRNSLGFRWYKIFESILRCRKMSVKILGWGAAGCLSLRFRSCTALQWGWWGQSGTRLLHELLISLCCHAQEHIAVWLSAVMLFPFVHAAAGFPKAVPQGSPDAAGTSCVAHSWSLFWFLPHFGGLEKGGLCSQHSSAYWYTCIPSCFPAPSPSWVLTFSGTVVAGWDHSGAALCQQPRGLLGSVPENFTLSTLANLLRKICLVLLKILLCKTAS